MIATRSAIRSYHREIVRDEQVGQRQPPPQLQQQVEHGRLHRHVQTRGRLVQDQHARLQAAGCAPGRCGGAGRRRTRADSGGRRWHRDRPPPASPRRAVAVRPASRTPWISKPSCKRAADAPPRIQRRGGVLVHILDGAADAARLLRGQPSDPPTFKQDFARMPRAAGPAPCGRAWSCPEPDSPTSPRIFAAADSDRLTSSPRAPEARRGEASPSIRLAAPICCAVPGWVLRRSCELHAPDRGARPQRGRAWRRGGANRQRARAAWRKAAAWRRCQRGRHAAGNATERCRSVRMAGEQRRV